MHKFSSFTIALFQVAALVLYLVCLGWLGMNGERWVGPMGAMGQVMGTAFILLVFVLSALISGLATLGYPALLFWRGQQKRAIGIVGWTAVWICVFLAAVVVFIIAIKANAALGG